MYIFIFISDSYLYSPLLTRDHWRLYLMVNIFFALIIISLFWILNLKLLLFLVLKTHRK